MAPTDFINYPPPIKAAETPYENPPPSNPTLSGTTLSVLSNLVVHVGPVQQMLWRNTGFTQSLLKVESSGILDNYVPRYDPTVIPVRTTSSVTTSTSTDADDIPVPAPRTFHSSADYIAAYKSGVTTPTAVAERFLESLDEDISRIFICTTPREVLLAAAAESTARYAAGTALPLDGVPLVVKDECDVAGTQRTLGLSTREANLRKIGHAQQGQTSWCVQKLLDAGMMFLGKSNMHEIGLDTTNNNPNWGTPPNPYNSKYYPGGSSGGSGAAVGAGICPIAVGADGGGSIRIPATYCGVFGLKPTHGRVDTSPTASIAPSVGVVGPIAATMHDLALAYRIMSTPHPSSPFPAPTPSSTSSPKILGIYRPYFDDCDPTVLSLCNSAISKFQSLGYKTVPITLPLLPESRASHALTILSEISQGMGGNSRGLTPANKILISVGTRAPARDFLIAQKLRALMMSHLAALWQEYPGMIIVTPTAPHAGVEVHPGSYGLGEAGVSDNNKSLRTMQYVFLANWTGCPAISLPVGYEGGSNMPVGLMGMGEWGAEEGLITWGREWEDQWDVPVGVLAQGILEQEGRKRGEGWRDMLASVTA
ncbi:amidase signature domain-containing protein [Pyronema omphalodes]|nr:amidase signature domain-containing protein [Pyronema omphalodes]